MTYCAWPRNIWRICPFHYLHGLNSILFVSLKKRSGLVAHQQLTDVMNISESLQRASKYLIVAYFFLSPLNAMLITHKQSRDKHYKTKCIEYTVAVMRNRVISFMFHTKYGPCFWQSHSNSNNPIMHNRNVAHTQKCCI